MTGNDFEEFLKKDISSQIDVFRNSSLDDKKLILLKLDPELRKNILTNISIDELKEFIIAVDFDKKIINLISNNLINSIFKSFTTDERDYKFKLLKSIDLNEDWFDSLLDSEKKDFIKSLSVKEIDDYIYYSKGNVRESIYQILGNNYIKDNISNMSFRSARVVIGMLESDIFRKESDIRVSEGAFNKHNKKDGENKNSMLDNMKKELDDMKNTLQVSKQAHEKNSTEFNQLIAEFSSKVAKLRSKIPRGEKRGKHQLHAGENGLKGIGPDDSEEGYRPFEVGRRCLRPVHVREGLLGGCRPPCRRCSLDAETDFPGVLP